MLGNVHCVAFLEEKMPGKTRAITGNRILDALSQPDFNQIFPRLKPMELPITTNLYKADQPLSDIYFLTAGMASIVAQMGDGGAAEVGIVGREGFIGGAALLGGKRATHEIYMQMGGAGLRMSVRAMRDAVEALPAFKKSLLDYTLYMFSQITQTAACNARHPVELRLARWLLMAHDRVIPGKLHLTQEFLAMMLGVQRPGVSIAAGALKKAGMIDYSHGSITVLDRQALETASCGCYRVVKAELDRLCPS